ncbi:MAG: hypothetical protein ACRCYS_07970 [Beijerinckiaceae bacterium]
MSTIRKVEDAVRHTAQDAQAGAESLAHEAKRGADHLAAKASETWQDAKSYAEDAAHVAGEKAVAAKDAAADLAHDAKQQVSRMLEERPLTTLAIGMGLAFAAGALWKLGSGYARYTRQPAWYEMDRWRR